MKKKAFISGRSHFSLFLKNMIFQKKQLFLLIHTEEADSPTQLKK
mgnify:CR=1 FL=1